MGDIQKINIHDNIDSTLELLFNRTKNLITIEKKYGELPIITALPAKLNQVFMNLFVNAIDSLEKKNGQENNKIIISTSVNDSKKMIEILISDNGIGIDNNIKSRIFEPFFTTKDVGEGTGLGLAIVHGIIESHQGEIEAFNNDMGGVTVRIMLPLEVEKGNAKKEYDLFK